MKLGLVSTLMLPLVLGCGHDRRAPKADEPAGSASTDGASGGVGGASDGGTASTSPASAGAAGALPTIEDLCDADCDAQRGLGCVDASTCLDRCRLVYDAVGERGCSGEYIDMLECVAEVDRDPYVCLDRNTFGFDEASPCFAYSETLSACLEA